MLSSVSPAQGEVKRATYAVQASRRAANPPGDIPGPCPQSFAFQVSQDCPPSVCKPAVTPKQK